MTVAETITHHRTALGLSQRDLARAVGVNVRTVRRWEHGDSAPQNHYRLRLARVLGVDPTALAR